MASFSALVGLAFSGSIGMTLVILGCALPGYGNWWPFFVVLFYLLSPIPYALSQRYESGGYGGSNACRELSLFLISGLVLSAYALPCVLAHAVVIKWQACVLTLLGNSVVFPTILGFFLAFDTDNDTGYNVW